METRARKRQRVEPEIGYKKAQDGYIVKLEIRGKNNENRSNIVDPIHAKYRCSEATVLDIFHWKTGKKIESIGGLHNPKFIYNLNETIITRFDKNLEVVCSEGIHYFKTLEQAENWGSSFPRDGKFVDYHDNGRKAVEYNIINGIIEGEAIEYHHNGRIHSIAYYSNGNLNGKCENFDFAGNKFTVRNYKDGALHGKYIEYYLDGNVKHIRNLKNNKLDGKQEFYDKHGTLKERCYYKDGVKVFFL